MAAESEAVTDSPETWNYFNYFTEVEEHFQRARGTGLFLLSPLDWTLAESWKNEGIPLEAVLRGIDVAFEKSRSSRRKHRIVNSLAYCAQAVKEEADAMAKGAPAGTRAPVSAPFDENELRQFLDRNASVLAERPEFNSVSSTLKELASNVEIYYANLEELEQRLTALEEKLSAIVRASVTDEELFSMRRELESAMRPYRDKMSTAQIAMLERQYLDRRVQEKAGLPRLSLFYLK